MKVRKLPNGTSFSVHFQHYFAHRLMSDATGIEEDPFTFEIIRRDETPVVVNVLPLSGSLAIWCQVEAVALRIEHSDGVYIRVKNPKGETVIRTGVAVEFRMIA
jgi:hypothetical protein